MNDTPLLALTHGAGGNRDTPGLVSLAESLAERNIRTLRFNLPAAEAGRRRPDRSERAIGCVAAVADWAAREFGAPLFLGGRSFGGRMASLLLADPDTGTRRRVAGLVLLAYPLKPPGKAEVPPERMEHLPRIGVPTLFVSGDRDPFAPPALLNPVVAAARAEVSWITGGDHGFRVPKAVLATTGRTAANVRDEIAGAVAGFVATTAACGPTRGG
ncbi:MAG: dienelactone hydrolase [Acidobacteria bacterium]|nr:dienelactone hydrolase [Acidobacteriota bacterium]MYF76520.1 dienelactone hydrolase [Acidobacteriota bacterium]MYG75973.1 dienelactone hydrolase [Acidobacteriota bacterium]